jgi:hypothetical protein
LFSRPVIMPPITGNAIGAADLGWPLQLDHLGDR